jgi:hypothetical protein
MNQTLAANSSLPFEGFKAFDVSFNSLSGPLPAFLYMADVPQDARNSVFVAVSLPCCVDLTCQSTIFSPMTATILRFGQTISAHLLASMHCAAGTV